MRHGQPTPQGSSHAAMSYLLGLPGFGKHPKPLIKYDASCYERMYIRQNDFWGCKFGDPKNAYENVVHVLLIPFCVTSNQSEASKVKELVEISTDYITAVFVKDAMTESFYDPERTAELSVLQSSTSTLGTCSSKCNRNCI